MWISPSSLQRAAEWSWSLVARMGCMCKWSGAYFRPGVRRLWTCTWRCDLTPRSSRVEPTQEGDYEICFDNSFSHFSEKMVFFEIILEGQGGDVGGDEEWAGLEEPDGSLLEYKLEDIRVSCLLCLCVFLNSWYICSISRFTDKKVWYWWCIQSALWHVNIPWGTVLCGERVQAWRWCHSKGQTHSTQAGEVGIFSKAHTSVHCGLSEGCAIVKKENDC